MAEEQLLTDEQYTILLEQENAFETLVTQGWCKNFDIRFLSRMQRVYQDFYNSPLNVNCGDCVKNAMVRLWNQMEKKRGEIKLKKENAEKEQKSGTGKSVTGKGKG